MQTYTETMGHGRRCGPWPRDGSEIDNSGSSFLGSFENLGEIWKNSFRDMFLRYLGHFHGKFIEKICLKAP